MMIRKNKKAAKIITTAIAIVVMLGTFFVQPSFAENAYPVAVPKIDTWNANNVVANGIQVASTQYTIFAGSKQEGSFVCLVKGNSENSYFVYFLCYTQNYVGIYNTGGGGTEGSTSQVSSKDYYDRYFLVSNITNTYLPIFDTTTDARNAFESMPQGTFYDFPQGSYNNLITYELIEGNGVMVYASPNTYHLYGIYGTNDAPTSQYCYIDNGDETSSFAVFSSIPLTVYSAFMNGGTYSSSICSNYDTGKYYYVFPETIQSEIENSFASLEEAQEAFSGASSGAASGVSSAYPATIELPAGNVLYARCRSGSIGKITTTYPYLSNWSKPYWSTAVRIKNGVSSLPDENTTFPLSGSTIVEWALDETSVNGMGLGYNGYVSLAPQPAGWLTVYNPTYYNYSGTQNNNISPTVYVNLQYCIEYYIYDLTENMITGVVDSNTDYSSRWHGTYDDTIDQWDLTPSETAPVSTPVVGGQQNAVVNEDMSIGDYLQSFGETIKGFANNLLKLFTAPIGYIQTLVAEGTAFMSFLLGMWSWLPQEITALLMAALAVLIVIGIIKVLHR